MTHFLFCGGFENSEDEQKDDGFHSRISSASFLMIMEDGIRTFMSFLKADKERPCQILAAYFRRNQRPSVDPTLLRLMKKVNQKARRTLNYNKINSISLTVRTA